MLQQQVSLNFQLHLNQFFVQRVIGQSKYRIDLVPKQAQSLRDLFHCQKVHNSCPRIRSGCCMSVEALELPYQQRVRQNVCCHLMQSCFGNQ